MIFDTHAHYDDGAFDEDRAELLTRLKEEGIKRIVNVSSGMDSCLTTMELADKHDFIYAAVGVHPSETSDLTDADMELVRSYCKRDRVVAIGEIGLDYHWPEPAPDHQKKYFIEQLKISEEMDMPVIIHSRDAAADTMEILKKYHSPHTGGVIHCYSYSADQAVEYVKMGFFIGVGGVVTFKNSRKLKESVEAVPMERIVLETDCPYLAPEPVRGTRNSSLNLVHVIKAIAQIKGLTEREVEDITFENALKLYRLKGE